MLHVLAADRYLTVCYHGSRCRVPNISQCHVRHGRPKAVLAENHQRKSVHRCRCSTCSWKDFCRCLAVEAPLAYSSMLAKHWRSMIPSRTVTSEPSGAARKRIADKVVARFFNFEGLAKKDSACACRVLVLYLLQTVLILSILQSPTTSRYEVDGQGHGHHPLLQLHHFAIVFSGCSTQQHCCKFTPLLLLEGGNNLVSFPSYARSSR